MRIPLVAVLLTAAFGCSTASSTQSLVQVRSEPGQNELRVSALFERSQLPNVSVAVWNRQGDCRIARTDVAGQAVVVVPPGRWFIQMDLPGLEPARGEFRMKSGRSVLASAEFKLHQECGPFLITAERDETAPATYTLHASDPWPVPWEKPKEPSGLDGQRPQVNPCVVAASEAPPP